MTLSTDYDPNLFVTPREVVDHVHAKIDKWQRSSGSTAWRGRIFGLRSSPGPAPGDLVLSFVGERGAGKTWLLRHFAQEEPLAGCAVYVDLEDRHRRSNVEEYVQDIADQVARQGSNGGVLLLLDHVPPHLDEHLRALEDVVLRPQLASGRSMFLMGLIHPTQVCWRAPGLRGGETVVMPHFDEAQTRLQLRRLERAGFAQASLPPGEVWHLSDGLPLLNYLLAAFPRVEAFQMLLDYWLTRVPPSERDVVRACLEAVCMLKSLEHAAIRRALDVYAHYHGRGKGLPIHAGGVPNLLRKYWLARPAGNVPGRIVLVESVQRAVQEVVGARHPALLKRLKEAA